MKRTALALAAGLVIVTVLTIPSHAAESKAKAMKPEAAAPAQMTNEPIAGKVIETMDAGGYTYVHLDDNGKKTWVAAPKMKAKVGDMLVFMPGNVMPNFRSDSLNRTFDTIIFSPGPVVLPGTKADKAQQSGADSPKVKKVEKASGKEARSVAECYAQSAKLDKKTVTVRGKVVKVSKRIMGMNWVHLQDGTGEPEKGTHDLVFTTDDLPEVDAVVTATGTLARDKDFGYGYKFDVIVEDAKIKK